MKTLFSAQQSSNRSITLMSHQFPKSRLSVHSSLDLRLSTNETSQVLLPAINMRYASVHDHETPKVGLTNPMHIQSYIKDCQKNIPRIKEQVNIIREEMATIPDKHEKELQAIYSEFSQKLQIKYQQLKEDNITNIMEQYKLKKDVIRLMRQKSKMEQQIQELYDKISELEQYL